MAVTLPVYMVMPMVMDEKIVVFDGVLLDCVVLVVFDGREELEMLETIEERETPLVDELEPMEEEVETVEEL